MLVTNYPEQTPANLPPGIEVFGYLPFSKLLPRSALLVYHGGIGIRLGSSALDARPFSLSGQPAPKASYNRVTGTATFGGPLRIPHLLRHGPDFFVSYQWTRDHDAEVQSALVPDLAQRMGTILAAITEKRIAMIQPYLNAVNYERERSLMFVGGDYSHAVLRTAFNPGGEHSEDPFDASPAQLRDNFFLVRKRPLEKQIEKRGLRQLFARIAKAIQVNAVRALIVIKEILRGNACGVWQAHRFVLDKLRAIQMIRRNFR